MNKKTNKRDYISPEVQLFAVSEELVLCASPQSMDGTMSDFTVIGGSWTN